jgi:hypothetical protein
LHFSEKETAFFETAFFRDKGRRKTRFGPSLTRECSGDITGRPIAEMIMATPSQKKASNAHRRRGLARGLVRVEVKADKADAGLLRTLAETLRGDPDRARSLRSVLEQALIDPQVKTAFDLFGSDLPDEAFAGVFDQPRQKDWREIDL